MTVFARPPAIEVTGLRKSFGDHVVLDGIDLTVAEGTIFSLLGPNGAGKTTAVNILSTLIHADAGQIRVAGHDLATDLAMTLVGDPRIIFLDEPTTGLDPRSRRTMWQIIRDLAASGVTLLLTTQYLDEADQLADRIAVLDRGHLVAEGTPGELKRRIPGGHIELRFRDLPSLADAAMTLGEASADDEGLVLRIPADGTPQSVKDVLDQLGQQVISADQITVHTPDLDDVFFALTGSSQSEQEIPA